MCGIAGFVSRESEPGILTGMLNAIAHRGPDGEGRWEGSRDGWSVSLGHRRLAIIDLTTGGQPLGRGETQITFNGEIYNYRTLRDLLPGVRFQTASDTEVLFELMLAMGPAAALPQLNGMFAFALWDKGTLLLARDRAGIKPLYYAELPGGGLAFASELSALLAHPKMDRRIDPDGLAEFFFLDYAHAPRSLLSGVKKLEPGCFLTWTNGKLSAPLPYWRLSAEPSRGGLNEFELMRELRGRLERAVESELVADVPVGVLLSGGLDSSLVAAMAQARLKEPALTFSIGFEDAAYDESRFARQVAEKLETRHTEKIFSEGELLDSVDEALGLLDEPMADPSILPTLLLAETAGQKVKVALGGDGGDELWAGYPTYRAARLAKFYANAPTFARELLPQIAALFPARHTYQSFEWKLKRFTQRWDDAPLRRHFRWMSGADEPALKKISASLSLEAFWGNIGESALSSDALNRELALDFLTYLPGSVLAKVDRAAMAHGLEVRPPFLDPDFVDWSFSVPSRWKLHRNQSKYLLKRAALAYLPPEIVYRKKKGFGIPLARWLCGPLGGHVENCLAESPLWEFLYQPTFRAWFEDHRRSRADQTKPLWAMLVLDRWVRRFGCRGW